MTKTIFRNSSKINVSYTTENQVYRIKEVVEGGEQWTAQQIHQARNKIVDAIHHGYSAI